MSDTRKSKIKKWNLSYSIYKYYLWAVSIVDSIKQYLVTDILEKKSKTREQANWESHITFLDKTLFSVAGL